VFPERISAMPDMKNYDEFKAKFIRRLVLGMIVAAALMLAFAAIYTRSSGIEMSGHGWIAMIVGTVISFAIAGTLTAVMVLGRRSGGDEAAGDIEWE